jgi:hypothetical protein
MDDAYFRAVALVAKFIFEEFVAKFVHYRFRIYMAL